MKHFAMAALAASLVVTTAGPAAAQWVYKPSKTVRSVEKGVAVYRGPARPVDLDAIDARLAGATPQTITVRVTYDPVLRYPPRRLTTHGFVTGVRRYYRSIGPVPGRTYSKWFDQFPGGY